MMSNDDMARRGQLVQPTKDRLQAIVDHWYPAALRGDPAAADIVLRATELLGRYCGVDFNVGN